MRKAIALVWVLLGTVGAAAQNDVCVNPSTRQVDAAATETFRQMAQASSRDVMQTIAGTWYAEIPSPSTNQIQYQYQQFDADGLFQYQDRVCGGLINTCSDYAGHGLYAVIQLGDGSLQFLTIVSDLNRDRQCIGSTRTLLDSATMRDAGGILWRRVQ